MISRRKLIQKSALGILGAAVIPHMDSTDIISQKTAAAGKPYPAYPSLDPGIVSEVVGKSHFDLERVKELVEAHPELAKAVWEWRFGDFESAIGAASHVGRRDIILYLLSNGASPSIFTFAALGAYEIVKGIIDVSPGIQTSLGPHGISLLGHSEAGLRMEKSMSQKETDNCRRLIDYLEELDGADGPQYLEIPEEEKQAYLGNYMYGEGKEDGFTIQFNMRNQPSLGPVGGFGGALYKIEENLFTYNGAPSVRISFLWEGDSVKSLTIKMPGSEVTAIKT